MLFGIEKHVLDNNATTVPSLDDFRYQV